MVSLFILWAMLIYTQTIWIRAKLQLTREPRSLPTMKINPDVQSIFDFDYTDFELVGYDPHPHIKAEVAV